jgi:predicted Fe-S protein YdhL (DUF1289 family)
MSAPADEPPELPEEARTGEDWQDLSREEQREILDKGHEYHNKAEWERLPDGTKRRVFESIEQARDASAAFGSAPDESLSETERAMRDALEETWTANLFEHLDDHPTVPFEMHRLPERLRDQAMEVAEVMFTADEQAEDVDDIEELLGDTAFDSLAAVEDWLWQFLEYATTDSAFDYHRWESGRNLVEGTRLQLIAEVYARYQEDMEAAQSFRAE